MNFPDFYLRKLLREYLLTADKTVEEIVSMSVDPTAEMFIRKEALKDHNWTAGGFKNFSFAANSITGFRLDQEDRYTCLVDPNFTGNWSFFGVYDGHGGAVVAEYLKRKLHDHILEQFKEFGDMEIALDQGFQACDRAIRDMKEDEFTEIKDDTMKEFFGSEYQPSTSGCAIHMSDELYAEIKNQFLQHLLALQTDLNRVSSTSQEKQSTEKDDKPEVRRSKRVKRGKTDGCSSHSDGTEEKDDEPVLGEKKTEDEAIPLVGLSMGSTATVLVFTDQVLYIANIGDSRCIASINGNLYILSYDHRPLMENEKRRILESGHTVTNNRVDGVLNLSRAFGDFTFKDRKDLMQKEQALTAEPYITSIPINDLDFVLIASDGIWKDAYCLTMHMFVEKSLYLPIEEIISETFERILLKKEIHRGLDNLTAIIIKNDAKCEKVSEQFLCFTEEKTKEERDQEMKAKKTENNKSEMEEEEKKNVETKETKTKKSKTNAKKVKKFKK